MARPITLFTGQWADLPFEEVARLASEWGYDGLEIACWGDHVDVSRWDDAAYVADRKAILEKNGLNVWTISNHLAGQAVCDDPIDQRHRDILNDRGNHRENDERWIKCRHEGENAGVDQDPQAENHCVDVDEYH